MKKLILCVFLSFMGGLGHADTLPLSSNTKGTIVRNSTIASLVAGLAGLSAVTRIEAQNPKPLHVILGLVAGALAGGLGAAAYNYYYSYEKDFERNCEKYVREAQNKMIEIQSDPIFKAACACSNICNIESWYVTSQATNYPALDAYNYLVSIKRSLDDIIRVVQDSIIIHPVWDRLGLGYESPLEYSARFQDMLAQLEASERYKEDLKKYNYDHPKVIYKPQPYYYCPYSHGPYSAPHYCCPQNKIISPSVAKYNPSSIVQVPVYPTPMMQPVQQPTIPTPDFGMLWCNY